MRSPRSSASSDRPSRTRARGFATRARTWPGRSASAHERPDQAQGSAAPPPARARQDQRHVHASAAVRLPLQRGIQAQLIDDVQGHTLAAVNRVEGDLKGNPEGQAKHAGELLAERAKDTGIKDRVRSRRLPIPWPVKALADGAREGGTGVFSQCYGESSTWPLGTGHATATGAPSSRYGSSDQPRRQGRQGRQTASCSSARRRRRREGAGRRGLGQGQRGPGGHPEGRRRRARTLQGPMLGSTITHEIVGVHSARACCSSPPRRVPA